MLNKLWLPLAGVFMLLWPAVVSAQLRPLKVVMVGDSLTAGCNWPAEVPEHQLINQGVGGWTTAQMLANLGRVIEAQPEVVFIQGGINDLSLKIAPEVILENHREIWRRLAESLPNAKLYVVSLLPVADERFPGVNAKVRQVNQRLSAEAPARGVGFIDIYPLMTDSGNQLKEEYHWDGIHLRPEGYAPWLTAVRETLKQAAQ